MIPKISRGSQFGGLVRYLGGPGKSNEHAGQRVLGGSLGYDGPLDKGMQRQVAADLRAPLLAYPEVAVKDGPVWHCSLSLAEREGTLSDEKWRAISEDFIREMRFDGSVRWVAVRHGLSAAGNDHVHLVVNLVREDGRQVNIWRDRPRAQAACNRLERAHGLEVLASREAGAGRPGLSAAELERSRRTGQAPERERLELRVRAAAKTALTEGDFVRNLRGGGVEVRPWVKDGAVAGYAVREPGGVWFGGSKLGRDLTLPRLRAGWVADRGQPGAAWADHLGPARLAAPVGVAAHRQAAGELRGLERRVGRMSGPELAGAAHDVAGALSAAAARRPELAKPARELGGMAGVRAHRARPLRLARSAALLVVQAMDDRDEVRQGILLAQLLATAQAIKDADRARRAAAQRGGGRMESDGLDEPVEAVATVGVTVAARHLEARARDREAAAQERQRTAVDVEREAGRVADRPERDAVRGTVDPFRWQDADKPITPRQREVLERRGYAAEDLAGMPRRVASRHIGGELGPDDAHRSRGQRPVDADVAGKGVAGPESARPALVDRQERERREQAQRRNRRRRQ